MLASSDNGNRSMPNFSLSSLPQLPILEVLAEIEAGLSRVNELVLEAPPGAGKTTLVPLALLSSDWLKDQKILMLEPRRMAARAAAVRMAQLLDETVGKTVGYRIRQESRVSKDTRIEIITEGILTRLLQEDPSLEGVGLVIFDEYHERSMDADVGLALCLQGRALFRETQQPLKLLIMSATLDTQAVAKLLNDAPVIRSEGKMFPVNNFYSKSHRVTDNIIEPITRSICRALTEQTGSLLVFLPGQGEIRRVEKMLASQLPEHFPDNELRNFIIQPLYGALPLDAQRKAIEPLASPYRKIVLATDIAETSLTIEGVSVVIDSGLSREPVFDPRSGMTRLQTRRLSKASSIQRMGRAGRLEPGNCYRLWSREQQQQLEPHSVPQILQADVAPLVLQLFLWGIDDVNELSWLDPPPNGPLHQAIELLVRLGALSELSAVSSTDSTSLSHWQLTHHGKQMALLPVHPRLAHMLLRACEYGLIETGCALAALLSERNPLNQSMGADLSVHLDVIQGNTNCPQQHRAWLQRTRKQLKSFSAISRKTGIRASAEVSVAQAAGFLISCAYPDRIAQAKNPNAKQYQLSNGRTVMLSEEDALGNVQWLSVAELGGQVHASGNARDDRIFSATALDPELFAHALSMQISTRDNLHWDERNERFIAEQERCIGALCVEKRRLSHIPQQQKVDALIDMIRKRDMSPLPWNDSIEQWCARVNLLHTLNKGAPENPWPDLSRGTLTASLEHWLAPYIGDVSRLTDFQKLDLKSILMNLLPWPLPQQLEELSPVSFTVPSGSSIKIDYTQYPPILAVKVQEMFGCKTTPAIAQGKIKLTLHLLSPARRPLQVTQDLEGFWKNSYFDVQKEMKGRYPKHPWPDNPLDALPTRRVKHPKR